MARIGKELLSSAKAAARASATEKGETEKLTLYGRDLLSLLVKANIATDIPENQRLSDEDVLARAFCRSTPSVCITRMSRPPFSQSFPRSWWPVMKLQGMVSHFPVHLEI